MAHRVVIYGGSGNLGRSLITLFNKNNWVSYLRFIILRQNCVFICVIYLGSDFNWNASK